MPTSTLNATTLNFKLIFKQIFIFKNTFDPTHISGTVHPTHISGTVHPTHSSGTVHPLPDTSSPTIVKDPPVFVAAPDVNSPELQLPKLLRRLATTPSTLTLRRPPPSPHPTSSSQPRTLYSPLMQNLR